MTDTVWLSQSAYDRLSAELEELTTEGRRRASKAIEIARAHGDLRENAEYDAAKEEQGKQEARIRQLRALLDDAKVGEPAAGEQGVVGVGMVVTVDLAGDDTTFLLGSREVAGDTDLEVYSEKSPLGSAINGRRVGESVSYTAPNGREIPATIKDAKPFGG